MMGIKESSFSGQAFYFTLFCQWLQTVGQFANDRVFPCWKSDRVDFWGAKIDSMVFHGVCVIDDFRCMKQSFRRYASNIQANSSQTFIAFHQYHFFPQISRPECRSISPRSSTQNQDFTVQIYFTYLLRKWGCRSFWRIDVFCRRRCFFL